MALNGMYDWFDYRIATDTVNDIRSSMNRKIIPNGCTCVREHPFNVKCRFYNDLKTIIRCELLDVDSNEHPCLNNAIKVCIDFKDELFKPPIEYFDK